ncbi:MAG: peptidase MA family metallohydrolase [Candidatus Omnitrophota bacterium]
MKKYLVVLSLFCLSFGNLSAQETNKWQESRSTHFIVYYKSASPDFIQKVIDKSESFYNNIAESLGYNRYNFWLWDNRAKIYIHDNLNGYRSATGQPGWSAGISNPEQKIINSFPYAQGFFEHLLPHEIGHIIFREFIGLYNNAVPVWLDEGVASYQESLTDSRMKLIVNNAFSQNKLIALKQLFGMNPYLMRDTNTIGLFYAQSASLIEYLVKEFSRDRFVIFCQDLRDKKDFQKAMSSNYPFSNIQELEEGWKKYLKK